MFIVYKDLYYHKKNNFIMLLTKRVEIDSCGNQLSKRVLIEVEGEASSTLMDYDLIEDWVNNYFVKMGGL
jgi:hypothetical protein